MGKRVITTRVRLSPDEAKQWRLGAGKGSMSAFVRKSVEAAMVGKIDQAALDENLLAIRKLINAASEADSLEQAGQILSAAKQQINDLRGH